MASITLAVLFKIYVNTMALSLQDQLLKAGLADKKKANQVKREKHKKVKHQKKHKVVEADSAKEAAAKTLAEKQEKDRVLNEASKQQAEEKAIAAQIRQLITLNKQPKGKGDIACNFTDGTLVKRLYVDQVTQSRVAAGKLAIVKSGEGYEIVPTPVADKIAQRDENTVVYRADQHDITSDSSADEEDDWYADYEIPDDLTW